MITDASPTPTRGAGPVEEGVGPVEEVDGPGAALDPPTSIVGRATERATVHSALAQGRMVTLTGPAGVGKTRLAVAVAAQAAATFPAGRAFARLGSARPVSLRQTLAAALDVVERPGQPLEQGLLERLGQGRRLLVVDGCEHLADPLAGLLEMLLAGCPQLVVLATSRDRLGVAGERAVPVGPLAESEAVTLFVDRARGRGAGFEPEPDPGRVADLCAELGRLPLAVELAAARAGGPGWPALVTQLADRPPAAGRDAVEGDRTLHAVIDWSYHLLDDEARRLFRRLGVFVGGFDLAAVSHVGAGGDTGLVTELAVSVADLAGAGLLAAGPPADRWWMPGSVRRYALDQLSAAGEQPECRDRHLEWAVSAAAGLRRMADEGLPWRPSFDLVADDLRAALDGAAGSGRPAHELARSLGRLCYARQFLLEARQHFEKAAAYAVDGSAAAADLRAAADVSMARHLGEPAFRLLAEAARRAGGASDAAGQAVALASAVCVGNRFPATFTDEIPHAVLSELLTDARRVAPAGHPLVAAYLAAADAWNATGQKTIPDPDLARVALDRARQADDPVLIIAAIDAVSSADGGAGRFRAAHRLSPERIRQFDRLRRSDPRAGVEVIDTLHVAPLVAVAAGDLPGAVAAARRAWADPFSGLYMRASKQVVPLALSGRFDEALRFAATMWEQWQRVGSPAARWMAPAVHAAALVHSVRGERESHREWRDRADRLAAPRGQGHISDSFAAYAEPRAALHAGALDDALATAVDLAGVSPWPTARHLSFDAYSWAVAAEVAVAAGLPDADERLAVAAPAAAQCAWAAACLARASGRRNGDQDALRESVTGWESLDARFERACTLLLMPDRVAEGQAELIALGCRRPGRSRFSARPRIVAPTMDGADR
ncbi:MAG: hypothetical protein QOC94_2830 [Actinoplanes sp.]|nr:hypothetical protein [Actinoplanes sp.]